MSFPHSSRIAAILLAGSCTLAGIPAVPTVAAETASTAPIRYEFENGTTSGGKIYQETWKGNTEEDGSGEDYDLTNASGGGFSYLDQKGTTVSLEVTVPEDGLYELTVCYCEPYDPNKKVQYLDVNGVNQGEVSFSHNLTFEETSGGVVMLQAGKNTITFRAYWGYTMFDYLEIAPASESLTNLQPTRQLSNPTALQPERLRQHQTTLSVSLRPIRQAYYLWSAGILRFSQLQPLCRPDQFHQGQRSRV